MFNGKLRQFDGQWRGKGRDILARSAFLWRSSYDTRIFFLLVFPGETTAVSESRFLYDGEGEPDSNGRAKESRIGYDSVGKLSSKCSAERCRWPLPINVSLSFSLLLVSLSYGSLSAFAAKPVCTRKSRTSHTYTYTHTHTKQCFLFLAAYFPLFFFLFKVFSPFLLYCCQDDYLDYILPLFHILFFPLFFCVCVGCVSRYLFADLIHNGHFMQASWNSHGEAVKFKERKKSVK